MINKRNKAKVLGIFVLLLFAGFLYLNINIYIPKDKLWCICLLPFTCMCIGSLIESLEINGGEK